MQVIFRLQDSIMKFQPLLLSLLAMTFQCCDKPETSNDFDSLARDYVKLGLAIGQYDTDFVDAYYGPDSLRPQSTNKLPSFPKDDFLKQTHRLKQDAQTILSATSDDTLKIRSQWMMHQLNAFDRRIRMFSGETATFDEESRDLFATEAPVYPEQHYKDLVAKLDTILPGKGSVAIRYQQLFDRFNIPHDKIDTVFKVAIAEARRITGEKLSLPAGESFTLEYVRDKAWSGYNWYQGNFKSLIQINLDHPINIARAIDLACHEGYPGHHVYNVLLEKNLYHDKGWTEISLYPLFSPQSLIAEGTANYGIEVAFPEPRFKKFTKEVLLPLAGLDTADFETFFEASAVRKKLNFARNEIARGIINKTMSEEEITRWQTDYQFIAPDKVPSSFRFIEKYRSYVICYNHGEALVDRFVKARNTSNSEDKKWEIFQWILSNPVSPPDLELK
jgi:hypothetical protein